MAITQEAREARRAYKREWNRKNKDKLRQYMEKYWQKKAAQTTEREKQIKALNLED